MTHINSIGWRFGMVPLAVLAMGFSSALWGQQQPPPRPTQTGPSASEAQNMEGLVRGPVHEAFAQPYEMVSRATVLVDQQPPEAIDELPPRQVPVGEEYVWIPGYWGWDPADQEFIWISGCWRLPPEEMNWLPGDWVRHEGGYAWISGVWIPEGNLTMITKTPPRAKEEDPGQPPAPNFFWVPGFWDFVDNDFQWEPGFWAEGQADSVWVPLRYVWMPRGYLVADGYWDHRLENRGVLFGPVRFQEQRARIEYTPEFVIAVQNLPVHMFVYNDYGHYYFGDYYTVRPQRGQLTAWVTAEPRHYDPLRGYYTAIHRDRYDHFRTRHEHFLRNESERPPSRWQRDRQVSAETALAFTLADVVSGGRLSLDVKFREDQDRWQKMSERRDHFRRIEQQRRTAFGSQAADQSDRGDANRDRTDGRMSDRPREERPDGDRPAADRPSTDPLGVEGDSDRPMPRRDPARPDQPMPDQPMPDQPMPDQPKPDQPRAGTPDAEKLNAEKPNAEKPAPDSPSQTRPGRPQPGQDRPGADQTEPSRPGASASELNFGSYRVQVDPQQRDRSGRSSRQSRQPPRRAGERDALETGPASREGASPNRSQARPNAPGNRPGMNRPGQGSPNQADRPERSIRPERPNQPQRTERGETQDRPERPQWPNQPQRPERSGDDKPSPMPSAGSASGSSSGSNSPSPPSAPSTPPPASEKSESGDADKGSPSEGSSENDED